MASFDVFGTFLKFHPINSNFIQVQNDYIYILNESNIEIFHLPLFDKVSVIETKCNRVNSFLLQDQKMYLKNNEKIYFYKIKIHTNNK